MAGGALRGVAGAGGGGNAGLSEAKNRGSHLKVEHLCLTGNRRFSCFSRVSVPRRIAEIGRGAEMARQETGGDPDVRRQGYAIAVAAGRRRGARTRAYPLSGSGACFRVKGLYKLAFTRMLKFRVLSRPPLKWRDRRSRPWIMSRLCSRSFAEGSKPSLGTPLLSARRRRCDKFGPYCGASTPAQRRKRFPRSSKRHLARLKRS